MSEQNIAQIAEATITAPFQCSYCRQIFSRIDHLGRHVRRHTHEKPYQCNTCGKRFARTDLVKRHRAQHALEPSRPRVCEPHSRAGRRVNQACKACAASKLKCSDGKPCQRCVRRKMMCEYESATTAERRPSSQDSHTADIPMSEHEPQTIIANATITSVPSTSVEELSPPTAAMLESAEVPRGTSSRDSPPTALATTTGKLLGHQSEFQNPHHDEISLSTGDCPAIEQANFWPDEVARNYSEVLKDLLDSSVTSPIFLEGMDQAASTFWDTFMGSNEDFLDIADIPLLDLQPFDFEELEGRSTEVNDNEDSGLPLHIASAAATQAFRVSGWDWGPTRGDSTSAETTNLILPSGISWNDTISGAVRTQISPMVKSEDRDRLLSLLLHHCVKEQWIRIAPSFPSESFLDQMVLQFLASQRLETVPWFHIPSLRLDKVRVELLAAMVGVGACFTPREAVQRFGYVMPDILRYAVVECWTMDNTTSRDPQLLQAWLTQAELSTWSGNKRQMEIGESNYQQPITIIRRARWLRRDQYRRIRPEPSDESEALSQKWKDWIEQETRKRLIYRAFVFDAEMSMNNHVNPLMSYAEMRVPFPDPNPLWFAATAEEWKTEYYNHLQHIPDIPLTLADTVRLTIDEGHWSQPDLSQQVCHYTLYGLWNSVWELLQLYETTQGDNSGGIDVMHTAPSLMISVRREALTKSLHALRVRLDSLAAENSTFTTEATFLLEYLSMVLLVPLQGLQAFAGRDGEGEARRVYPALQEWAQTREARQAIWHAGQVYRAADALANRSLRGTCVHLVYQASVTLWVYGIMSRARRRRDQPILEALEDVDHRALIWLDRDDLRTVRKFIATSEGIPAIRSSDRARGSKAFPADDKSACFIEDASATMRAGVKILKRTSGQREVSQHAIVSSVSRLMIELAKVAEILWSSARA
ncbi:hypothetical protein C7974DRAFT_342198 [Boeremia exigua]|uniref:uncharacterized protein n=1 Tax=Boeremia exigua TaxID=749465 RepID=UPI001E8D1B4F|nr:uncharacterized protein C7974DRAFT_342198 [Boeremia exigua]KAH6619055.1 hypothetical protein C7974DRAFT_342198 [Boeremia exigua]